MQEFKNLTNQLLSVNGFDSSDNKNLFRLDTDVFDLWYDASELAKSGKVDEAKKIMLRLLVTTENGSFIKGGE